MSVDLIREPAVAGRFYPADPHELDRVVTELLRPTGERLSAVAAVAPHAGYVYSGAIAAETYGKLVVPERVIVLCPNHTGAGQRRSLWSGGPWRIGEVLVPIDTDLALAIRNNTSVDADRSAHLREHAIEVQVPLLLKCQPSLRLTPVCLSGLSYAECQRLADGIARAIRQVGEDVLVIASTDMSHYISAARARELDQLALDRLLEMDPEGLYHTVREHQISMCGYIPTTVALLVAREQGAGQARLVRYGNSGEVSGDFERVVGYAGAVIS